MSIRSTDDNLINLVMQLNRQLVKQLAVEGLPADQWRVLSLLRETPDGLTMGGICERLSMQAPSLTKLIDRMVMEALVYRVPNPNDRRNVIILPSEKGLALLNETDSRMTRYNHRLNAEFAPNDVEKLQKMLGHLLDDVND